MRIIRWLLVVPAAIAAWYSVFILALVARQYVVSGFCFNERIQLTLKVLEHTAVALSAVAVLVASTAMAPSHKQPAAWTTLALGLVMAGVFGFATDSWSLFLAAAIGGVLGATAIVHFIRKQAARSSLKNGDFRTPRPAA